MTLKEHHWSVAHGPGATLIPVFQEQHQRGDITIIMLQYSISSPAAVCDAPMCLTHGTSLLITHITEMRDLAPGCVIKTTIRLFAFTNLTTWFLFME